MFRELPEVLKESVNLHPPEDVREISLEERLFELSIEGQVGIFI